MATAENITGTVTDNQVVGKVVILYGNVKAISIDGTERLLGPNSPILAYDRIITESDGKVSIIIDDPAQSQIDIGRMSHIIIDEDIFAGVTAEDVATAAAEVNQIQEALLEEGFDPTVELEAPAAGGSATAGGGHPVPDFTRVTHEGEVTSGAETIGITSDTVDPIPGAPEQASIPAITADSGEVWEAGLADGSAPLDFNTTTSGSLSITHSDPTVDSTALLEIQDAAGDWIAIAADNTLVTGKYGNLHVDQDGAWRYELNDNTLEHPDNIFDDGDTDRGADDQVTDNFATRVTDTSGDMTDFDGIDPAEILTITINDDGPTAVDDETTGQEDETVTYNVLTNSEGTSDTPGADGATLTGAVLAPDYEGTGTVSFNENGEITFDPVSGFDGSKVEINYTLTDGDGDNANATLTILYPGDSVPTIVADTDLILDVDNGEVWESALPNGSGGGTTTDSGHFVIKTGNDSLTLLEVQDVNGDWIAITANNTSVTGKYGDLFVNPDGDWHYVLHDNTLDHPDNIFTDGDGDRDRADQVFDQFATRATDSDDDSTFSDGVQDSEILTIAINDDGPEAVNDFAGTYLKDTTVTYNVMGNDVPGADDVTTLTGATVVTPGAGVITGFTSNGNITFNPNPSFSGTALINYTITDGDGDNSTATLSINYDAPPPPPPPPPEPPSSFSQSISLVEGQSIPVIVTTGGENIPDGTYTGSLGGSVTVSGNSFTYTAPTRDHGNDGSDSDGPDSAVFTFNLPSGGTSTVTINITDTVPEANADVDNVGSGATATGNVTTALDIPGGDSNTDDGVADTTGADGWNPGGKVVGVSDSGTIITNGTGVGTGIITALGTLTLNADGSYTYDAKPDSDGGTDTFTYTIMDGDGSIDSTTLTINVGSIGIEPTTTRDSVEESDMDTDSTGDNDTDDLAVSSVTGTTPDNTGETVSDNLTLQTGFSIVSQQTGTTTYGQYEINTDGTYTYSLINPADQSGGAITDTIYYTAQDGDGNTVTNSLIITINDDVPIADPDTDSVNSGFSTTGNVVTDDDFGADGPDDNDGSSSTNGPVVGVVAGTDTVPTTDGSGVGTANTITTSLGTLEMDENGAYTYTAKPNVSGTDTFTYTIQDDDGSTHYTTLTIDVNDERPEPLLTEDNVDEEAMDLFDTDDDLAASSVTGTNPTSGTETTSGQITLPSGWTVKDGPISDTTPNGNYYQINADGTYIYTLVNPVDHTSDPHFEEIDFTIEDGGGNEVSGNTLKITITNDIPDIGDPVDVALANTIGSSETGDLDIAFGADGPSSGTAIQLTGPVNGSNFAIDNDGNLLTSTVDDVVHNLEYLPDSSGGLIAVHEDNHDYTVFTVSVNENDLDGTGEYTVNLLGILDGSPLPTTIGLHSGDHTGGIGTNPTFSEGSVTISALGAVGGDPNDLGTDDVNFNANGIGVDNDAKVNGNTNDLLQLEFYDSSDGTTLLKFTSLDIGMESATFKSGDIAYIQAYITDEFGVKTAVGSSVTHSYDVDGLDITFNPGGEFDTIRVTASPTSEFRVSTLSIIDTSEAVDHTVTYDFVATDYDLDTTDPGDSFDVTFDGDGTLDSLVADPDPDA